MEREEDRNSTRETSIPGKTYPYGLVISLNKEDLAKFGITELPDILAEVHIQAVGNVTYRSQSQTSLDVAIQITDMDLVVETPHPGEDSETEAKEFKTLFS